MNNVWQHLRSKDLQNIQFVNIWVYVLVGHWWRSQNPQRYDRFSELLWDVLVLLADAAACTPVAAWTDCDVSLEGCLAATAALSPPAPCPPPPALCLWLWASDWLFWRDRRPPFCGELPSFLLDWLSFLVLWLSRRCRSLWLLCLSLPESFRWRLSCSTLASPPTAPSGSSGSKP